jgi:hypothetical protein
MCESEVFRSAPLAVDRALLLRAKGALMLHYAVSSHEATAVLARWAKEAGTTVDVIAHTLVDGIVHGHPVIDSAEPVLIRWVENKLRNDLELGDSDGPAGRTAERSPAW